MGYGRLIFMIISFYTRQEFKKKLLLQNKCFWVNVYVTAKMKCNKKYYIVSECLYKYV